MNHTITKKRPYSFNALLSSLSSQVPDKQATWEQNLSLQAEKFYGQHSIQKKQENAAFIPTQRMLRDLITGTASSGGDLVVTVLDHDGALKTAAGLGQAKVTSMQLLFSDTWESASSSSTVWMTKILATIMA